ncbi:MAG: hypothetical protein C4523_12440 [Myxococcales bacterium]|nr:MAG: hypothetical protein C4523_12440 [Myxococcales bacterium]
MRIASIEFAFAFVALAAALLASGPVAAEGPALKIDKHIPGGSASTLTIDAGDRALVNGTIAVTYRPGSLVERTRLLPMRALAAGGSESLSFTPEEPGIVRLRYAAEYADARPNEKPAETQTLIGVTFAETPVLGVLVMFLAATILFGGCVFAFRLLTTAEE